MKIILLQDVKNVGKKNQIVDVNKGYFFNYLAKKQLAVIATDTAKVHLQKDLAELKKNESINVDKANELKSKIEKIVLNYKLQSNNGKAFGSISQKQIINDLKQYGITITKYMFANDFQPLKVGNIHITLDIYKDIKTKLHIIVTD
ncbi:MAG: 50S ribosomal protein L9 [Mycoplasma sp.]|nr:50S ribosomal protein L9 [Mycoplasma sp.]